MRSNFGLEARLLGTEFLDAETGRQKSSRKPADQQGRYGGPHQFHTRNDTSGTQRTRSISDENTTKSTKPAFILPLITVWFLVRVQAGPPMKSGGGAYSVLFGITAPETPRFVDACHAFATVRLTLHFVPNQALYSSIADSAGPSYKTAGLRRIPHR